MMNRITLQTDAPDATPADDMLARQIAEVLQKHYPGHPWDVNVSSFTGMVKVEHPALSARSGFMFPITHFANYGDVVKNSVMLGGEFLERFGLPRSWARDEQLLEAARKALFN